MKNNYITDYLDKFSKKVLEYNHKDFLKIVKIIKEIKKNIKCFIVVVDDSNNLKTKNIFRKKKFINVLYFHRGKKLGRGSAVIFGLKKLLKIKKINCFIEMDADMLHKPSELKRNISYFYNNSLDMLIGSRYLENSKIINWPLSRKILSKLSNMLARYFLGVPVNDYTNGWRFLWRVLYCRANIYFPEPIYIK